MYLAGILCVTGCSRPDYLHNESQVSDGKHRTMKYITVPLVPLRIDLITDSPGRDSGASDKWSASGPVLHCFPLK